MKQFGTILISFIVFITFSSCRHESHQKVNLLNTNIFLILTVLFIILLAISVLLFVLATRQTHKERKKDKKGNTRNQEQVNTNKGYKAESDRHYIHNVDKIRTNKNIQNESNLPIKLSKVSGNGALTKKHEKLEQTVHHFKQTNALNMKKDDVSINPIYHMPLFHNALLFSEMMRSYCLLVGDNSLYNPSDIPEFTSELFSFSDEVLKVFHKNYHIQNGVVFDSEWLNTHNAVFVSQNSLKLLTKILTLTCGLAGFISEKELIIIKQISSAMYLETTFIDELINDVAIKIVKQEMTFVTYNSITLNINMDVGGIGASAKGMTDTVILEILMNLVKELNSNGY